MTEIILVKSTWGLGELATCFVVSVLLLASTEVLLCFAMHLLNIWLEIAFFPLKLLLDKNKFFCAYKICLGKSLLKHSAV